MSDEELNMPQNEIKCKPSMMRKITTSVSSIPLLGKAIEVKDKVAVIRMSGVIADQGKKGGISWARYIPIIEKAFNIPDLDEVCLVINSPGGSPAQCSLISSLIRDLATEKDIPVTAFVEDVAASGGYWLACCADQIYIQNSSIIGSIGVIAAMFGFDDLIKKYGVERRVYTAGDDKSFMDPFQPEDEKAVKRLKDMQKEIHKGFIDWVKERRGNRLKGTDKTLFSGQVWVGEQAIERGLADEIGDVWTVMRSKHGKKVKFIPVEPDKPFIQSLVSGVSGSALIPTADDMISAIENKAMWNRFGL
jgi:signal peptide peptidase SppA